MNDGYTACLSNVPVVIKRFHRGGWRWVTTTSTGQNGGFRTPIANKGGPLPGQGAEGHAGERRGLWRKALERGAAPSMKGGEGPSRTIRV